MKIKLDFEEFIYPNGDKYLGEFKSDLPNGQGTYTSIDGWKYLGEWDDGQQHGQGTITYHDGENDVGE